MSNYSSEFVRSKKIKKAIYHKSKPQQQLQKPSQSLSNNNDSKHYSQQEIFVFTFYVLLNVSLFIYSWILNSQNPLAALLSPWLQLARGTGFLLNVNMSLILITVSRRLLTWLRNTWLTKVYPFDRSIRYHKRLAYMIMFLSIVHTIAHIMNFRIIGNAQNDDPDLVATALEQVGTVFPDSNPPTEFNLHLRTVPGLTGWIALSFMFIMYGTAHKKIRINSFEKFWYSHHLFIFVYILIMVHGAQMIVGNPPQFWSFVLIPLMIYTVERFRRFYNAVKGAEYYITKIIKHPSDTFELQIAINDFNNPKTTFHYKPGQYIFICYPPLSQYQWHPFTISSAPEDSYLSVHIRQSGDWTKSLANIFRVNSTRSNKSNISPLSSLDSSRNLNKLDQRYKLQIDGPYGTASEDVFNFSVAVLVGGGIGVTPFASILKSINYRIEAEQQNVSLQAQLKIKLKRIYFYWICRNFTEFEWFYELLISLENKKISDLLNINIHFTGDLPEYQRVKLKQLRQSRRIRDTVTGLNTVTTNGRPDWNEIFEILSVIHKDTKVGIFLCGNKGLSRSVRNSALRYKEIFKFHKENF